MNIRFPLLLPAAVFLLTAAALPGRAAAPAVEMAEKARTFLAGLSPDLRQEALIPFEDKERKNWHFVPKSRRGLPLKRMSEAQREQALALLKSGLSAKGNTKVATIMSLEEVLAELEGRPEVRDLGLYYVTIFGEPDDAVPWGWRWEGHHLSLNFSIERGRVLSTTPSFLGANPAEVKSGKLKGTRALAPEEDLGRALVKSLSPEQQKVAIIMEKAPHDIMMVPGRKEATPVMGLPHKEMSEAQKAALVELIREYLYTKRPENADEVWKRIEKAGLEKVHFAWAGGLERGQGHYYRVQGATFILEYDNTQNGANHVHAVWRDLANDFGEDLLGKHYEQAHGSGAKR